MNDDDQTVTLSLKRQNDLSPNRQADLPGRFWVYDDFTAAEDVPADFNASLVSLGFIKAAIRRSARLWVAMAVAGFLIGSAVYLASPHAAQASTTLLLTVGPEAVPGAAIQDDQAIAQSRAVAGPVVHKLGLPQSVGSFLASYTATPLTDRVLLITVSGPSSNDAVTRANAVATEFLRYRAQQLNSAQQQVFVALDQQINQAKQGISAIKKKISGLSAQSRPAAQQGTLTKLHAQLGQASSALIVLEQNVNNTRAATQETTTTEVNGSGVLDRAAPVPPHSKLKHLILYAAIGLVAGLALGLGFVVIRAIISDRLFRRDDVARALGAPVKLSVGTVRLSRWRPGRKGLAAAQGTNVRRIASHLDRAMRAHPRRAMSLAVVPVGDPQVAALSLMSLAVTCARQDMQVVVADLASGAPAASLLGSKKPGVHPVSVHNARLIVAVPERDELEPLGPLGQASTQAQRSPFSEAVTAACGSSNVLLTLAPLDPSLGGEHLATWAKDAVVVVTAGRSSWTKIHAAGEMIRLAGTRLVSAVLIGADKTDESLGVIATPEAGVDGQAVKEGSDPDPGASSSQPAAAQRSERSYDR
jgi:capsular polysaccharide biosynthesis protein